MNRRLVASLLAAFAIGSGGAAEVKDLNTPRSFPEVETKEQWQHLALEIRQNVLVSCGLWPLPPRTPLNAKIFGRVERDGYSIEKVYFQTHPGFFLAGNLYRPLGQGKGPFPGVLNPHGHWGDGRMADTDLGSIAARCISFARQGMVAFTYDMVGYNDTRQVDHKFASHPTNQLWSISLMGLQTWNSVRALDFLQSLEDVDPARLACTGESGGGTQTFMLGAIDRRLAVQAPVVMVSHSMQGGCLCENAPGLRVDHSNMEIAAVPAPRPQMLVAATGDWTRRTMEVEGPAIESIYRLFDAEQHFDYAIFDYPHNYNRESREAVYAWFGKHLLKDADAATLKEKPYQREPVPALLVFPEELPPGALNEQQLIASLIELAKDQLEELWPRDAASLAKWKGTMGPAWRQALQRPLASQPASPAKPQPFKQEEGRIRRTELPRARGDGTIAAVLALPESSKSDFVAVLVHPDGNAPVLQAANGRADKDSSVSAALLGRGIPVLGADLFLTGSASDPEAAEKRNHFQNYFTTHNRTDLQERLADLAVVISSAREQFPGKRVVLVGEGAGGLWAALAASMADATAADFAQFDTTVPTNLLGREIFFPGFLKLGGFAGALALAAPNPILLHNLASAMEKELAPLGSLYKQWPGTARFEAEKQSVGALVDWILQTQPRRQN